MKPPLEQRTSDLVSIAADDLSRLPLATGQSLYQPGALRARGLNSNRCALEIHRYERAHPRKGDERLSGRQQSKLHQADKDGASSKPTSGDASANDGGNKGKHKRSPEVGRALRSVYDDTLRENVPDDFMDLLGKLN